MLKTEYINPTNQLGKDDFSGPMEILVRLDDQLGAALYTGVCKNTLDNSRK